MTIVVSPGSSEGALEALRTSIQQKGYGTDTEAAQNSMINSVYRRIIGMRRWWFLEVANNTDLELTTGSDQVVLDIDDFLHLDAVRLESGTTYINLQYVQPQALRDLANEDRIADIPMYYTRINNRVHVWPIADRDYTVSIDYIKDPADLAADDDIPVIPAAYRDVLVWGAIKELCFRERDDSGLNWAASEYETILNHMTHQNGLEQRQTPQEVGRSGALDSVNGYLDIVQTGVL